MRIKRFNENQSTQSTESNEISYQVVDDIIKDVKDFASLFDTKEKEFESLINQLTNYKNPATGNDQIDNSIFSLEEIRSNIKESLVKISDVISNLESYKSEGRKQNK